MVCVSWLLPIDGTSLGGVVRRVLTVTVGVEALLLVTKFSISKTKGEASKLARFRKQDKRYNSATIL